MTPLDAALAYAGMGWRVVPCHFPDGAMCSCGNDACRSPAKHPIGYLVPHGLQDATTDPDIIRRWWEQAPSANVAIATGSESGIVVLDVDVRPDKDGEQTILDHALHVPETIEQITGGGGRHVFFEYPHDGKRYRSRTGIYPGLDSRGDGGYVLVYPSRHLSGATYQWEASCDPLAFGMAPSAAPAWFLDRIRVVPREASHRAPAPAADQSEVSDALAHIDPDCSYEEWIECGMAIKASLGEPGYAAWLDWSARGEKYPGEAECLSHWQSFKGSGVTARSIFKKAQESGWTNPGHGQADPEAVAMAERMAKKASKTLGPDDPLPHPFDHPADSVLMAAQAPPPREWLFFERLERGKGAILVGIGGSSKTRMMYQMAIAAVLGWSNWGWKVSSKGKAVLFLLEDADIDAHHTLHYVLKGLGITGKAAEEVASRILIYPLAGHRIKLLERTATGALAETGVRQIMEEVVRRATDVVFVGMDPALALTEGDENDQSHARELGDCVNRIAQNTRAAVLMISHASKGLINAEELGSHSSRGASAFTDAIRAEYVMRTMTKKEAIAAKIRDIEERMRHVQLVGTKHNTAPPSAKVPLWFRRNEHGVLMPADVNLDDSAYLHPNVVTALGVLRQMGAGGSVPLKDWQQALTDRRIIEGNPETAKKAMQAIYKKLMEEGLIERPNTGYYRPIGEIDDEGL